MKTKLLLFFLALFSCSVTELSAQCIGVVDSDNYSSSSGWTATGAGNVTISGGACTFLNAADDTYDRVYRPLAATLSDTYFKAEFKFVINGNPAGNGVGTNIFALGAGTLDPISYDASQSYALTNQDGFIIELISSTTTTNNVNNWGIYLDYKDGATRTTGANSIPLNASVLTYYVVFERTSTTSTTINVYTDAAHTIFFGQAINPTVATVTGLNTLHHGVTTFGNSNRMFNGTVDDVIICDNSQLSTCTRIVDTENYSSSSAWSAAGAGNVAVSGGACTFQAAADGVYDRVYRPLASTISDNYFKAEFKFTIAASPAGHGVGTNLIALSAGSLDPISYDNSQSYATTNQDGLIVLLNSVGTTDNNVNNWYLSVGSKDGTTFVNSTNTVALNSSTLTYYVVLERTSPTSTTLSAFSDLAHTMLVGQATNAIPSTITGLNYLHHGVTTFGWNTREFTGYVDDVTICDDLVDGIETNNQLGAIHIFPNPSSNGQVTIDLGNSGAEMLFVYNSAGELIIQTRLNSNSKTIDLNLSSGLYFIQLSVGEKRVSFKQVVH